MIKIKYAFTALLLVVGTALMAQEGEAEKAPERQPGHTSLSKFRQMYQEFATPNTYRSASGSPGPDYYQQQADYQMDVTLDDRNARLYGVETIT
ncbi:MAG TPA: hypothetical protein VLL47_10250, partial [Robiginitalea sp.]|nr:hypothetical protein [Robiginitalea sp.]